MSTRPTFNNLVLAGKVRESALNNIMAILNDDPIVDTWSDIKKNLIVKMSSSVLPRLNEHSGPEGGEIKVTPIYNGLSKGEPTNAGYGQ